MFLENKSSRNHKKGWIEVICGSMFSGKTEELLRRIRRAEFANQKIELFKPAIDTRYDEMDVSGLDMDYKGVPFGPMPKLMAVAEYVSKQHAICTRCGDLAHFSHRIVANEQRVLLGEKDAYEPLCRHCYNEVTDSERGE